jgi:NADPH:quinone reductase-like Zn-dependent oxidoreductase
MPLGVVTCCGNVASPNLEINVFPFILRGVSLVGIDSQNCPMEHRQELWQNLAGDWKPANLDSMVREVSFEKLPEEIACILEGGQKGRLVVNLDRE